MLLTLVLLMVTRNVVTSENVLLTKKPQTGNPKSEISGTNQHGEPQSGRTSVTIQPEIRKSGNLDVEESPLYGFFPPGFLWGAATSALQVSNQPALESLFVIHTTASQI